MGNRHVFFDAICRFFNNSYRAFLPMTSLGYFDSAVIGDAICFMILAGMNFGLHFFAFKSLS